jgi:A/G-specific adenine glycosylase
MKSLLITNKILNWYDINKRSLPWRIKTSAKKKEYYTLVSEFMLQQTQVATVIPYFNRFIKNIPDLETLAEFQEEKLIKLWEGLGYYSRVKNLKKTAKIITTDFNKKIPDDFEKLKTLPGIGDYTASAILAIAFNKPFIPLDGNIERVLKRYFYLKKASQISKDYLIKKKKLLGVSKRSSDYAQALMELGALICKPKNPSCTECPLINSCKSFLKKDFVLTKIKKINKSKYFELSIIKKNNKYLLIKNNKFNFLKNFIIFPMIETKASSKFKKDLNIKISNMTMFIQIKFGNFYTNTSNAIWIDPGKLNNYTLPTFTKKIFRHLKNKI